MPPPAVAIGRELKIIAEVQKHPEHRKFKEKRTEPAESRVTDTDTVTQLKWVMEQFFFMPQTLQNRSAIITC